MDLCRADPVDRTKNDNSQLLVDQAARSFDGELHTQSYREIHSDSAHLDWILAESSIAEPVSLLDLGTGNGYVALAAAARFPQAQITGVDVATAAIARNCAIAGERGMSNLNFRISDGITLPFPSDCFDGVVSRYAFHHFPQPEVTLSEISRVLRPGGRFVFADAVRDDRDDVDFVNAFQHLKQDGHVEMMRIDDLVQLVQGQGFALGSKLTGTLSFDRTTDAAYDALIRRTPRLVLDSYGLQREGDAIRLTFPIFSAVFLRQGTG